MPVYDPHLDPDLTREDTLAQLAKMLGQPPSVLPQYRVEKPFVGGVSGPGVMKRVAEGKELGFPTRAVKRYGALAKTAQMGGGPGVLRGGVEPGKEIVPYVAKAVSAAGKGKSLLKTLGKIGGGAMTAWMVYDIISSLYDATYGEDTKRLGRNLGIQLEAPVDEVAADRYEGDIGSMMGSIAGSQRDASRTLGPAFGAGEAELTGLLDDNAAKIAMISRQQPPSLAEIMARAGVVP